MTATFMNAFYEALRMLKRSLGLYPKPLWSTMPLFNRLVFILGKCGGWGGIRLCIHRPRIPQGVADRRWIGTRKASQEVMK